MKWVGKRGSFRTSGVRDYAGGSASWSLTNVQCSGRGVGPVGEVQQVKLAGVGWEDQRKTPGFKRGVYAETPAC